MRSRTRPTPVERPDHAPRTTWRDDVLAASGLNLLAGIWLIIAPWVLGYRAGDPYWNDVLFGAIVAIFALTRMAGAVRATGLAFIKAAIGVWVFISAFVLDSSSTAFWNDIILGCVVFFLAMLSMSASEEGNARASLRR